MGICIDCLIIKQICCNHCLKLMSLDVLPESRDNDWSSLGVHTK